MRDAAFLHIPAAEKGEAAYALLDLLPSPRRSSKRSKPACYRLLCGLCQAQADQVCLESMPHESKSV